jgi:hypothetical protein
VNQEPWRKNEGKIDKIKAKWGESPKIKYLFYALDPMDSLPEHHTIVESCFAGYRTQLGDIRIDNRWSEGDKPAFLLRLRNAPVLLSEVVIDGQICPLVQASLDGCANFAPTSEVCLNFIEAAVPLGELIRLPVPAPAAARAEVSTPSASVPSAIAA